MNLNTKQHTMQYHTIPDGGDDDVVVLEHQQDKPQWLKTGRSYSVLGGLVLLLVAAAVVLQGGGGRPYDPAGSRLDGAYGTAPTPTAEGMVLASFTKIDNASTIPREPFTKCGLGFCYARCCNDAYCC